MKKLIYTLFITLIATQVSAQIDWSTRVANIIYSNCSSCHNPNGIAPFSLMSYTDATDNASDILDAVQDHSMPPWPPDPSYNRLAHERVLTDQEIADIADWVNNGTLLGDTALEPDPPVFSSTGEISSPDLVLSAPVYTVNTTDDLYRCFVIPTGLSTQQYINGLEAIPGDRSIVHHILVYSDTSATPVQLDAADPDPGYTNFGGTGSNTSQLIGIWVPGQSAYFTPTGMGIKLLPNANVILQVHYPGGISNRVDSTKINLKLSSNLQREIAIDAPLNHYFLDNGPLILPPNQTRTFNAHYDLAYDISTLAVGPHMHLLGRSVRAYAVTPLNDTIPFIDIPEWDFHWQGLYSFPRVLKVPAGSTLYSSAFYDNTTANPENPNDPPAWVFLGEGTADEMMLIYFSYTLYFPGDENIIIDSTVTTGINQPITSSVISTCQLYDPAPNPAVDKITIQYFIPSLSKHQLELFDVTGKLCKVLRTSTEQGLITLQFDIGDLPSGNYILKLSSDGIQRTKKIIRQ
jgi:Secretion system C-terminal sorting domain/Copper type II ascorbate-dependent monooxygenase, N-terminal domain/Copper type II ascorbate-dependent monooxygenase, C-terminal domain